MAETKTITPRAEDYAHWYTDVIQAAELADYSPVKGCMVIRPHGYAIWELLQRDLDARIRATGHENVYFPLFIPKSFLCREAEHVEGFAKECAIITHTRLRAAPGAPAGTLEPDPASRLEEELIVRPTSETIMYAMFARWIQSWRDLPLKLNQWANVVRWEMRTRLFLRTTEFLWQEGHTAHASSDEAEAEARAMLEVYRELAEDIMAMPVHLGVKTDSEKFAGADHTYCIEALMQDGKALQAGTSHHLGQNFAKSFDVAFQAEDGSRQYVWQTSWGVSTRLIGALIMTHSDDRGLVLPPPLAPVQVALLPIGNAQEFEASLRAARELAARLPGLRLKIDERSHLRPGPKYFEWEKKGVCLRVELGPRDLAAGRGVVVPRIALEEGEDAARPRKRETALEDLPRVLSELLGLTQRRLLDQARALRRRLSTRVDTLAALADTLAEHNLFVWAPWCGAAECESRVTELAKADGSSLGLTIRLKPFDERGGGPCLVCGRPAPQDVLFARAY